MNMSPLGGFAEGIAGGIRGASTAMAQGDRLKKERARDAAHMQMSMGFRFYELFKGNPKAQKNVLGQFVLPAFQYLSKMGAIPYPEEQIKQLFDNIDLTNENSKAFMDSTLKIFAEQEKGKLSDKAALDAFDAAVGTYTGELSGRQDEYLKQKRAQHIAGARKEEMASLFKDMPAKTGGEGQPSPLMSGLTQAYGKEAAGGIGAVAQAGTPLHQAAGMFPKKKAVAPPTTPMYKKKQLPGGGTQEMQYNPQTKKHDIAFGEAKAGKEGHYFRLGYNYYRVKNGKSVMIQEGSVDEKATMNAMKEFGWSMMSEPDQVALVAKHKRILTGKGKSKPEIDEERANAKAAIAAGVDPDKVKAIYKERTGKEY